MCGIAGLINLVAPFTSLDSILAMGDSIRHRGPDDVGYLLGNAQNGDLAWFGGQDTPSTVLGHNLPYCPSERLTTHSRADRNDNLALLNRRLAIVDLSPAGHQPLCNEDGSLWIVYNGEIYNSAILSSELVGRGHRFRSASDTEIVLHAYEEWGEDCLARFNGMWAFAIWDGCRKRLFLSRDRVGIKPLYYWFDGTRFAFGSEIKSLLALGLERRANGQAIYDFLAGNLSDHSSTTFFQGIDSLPPAHWMTVDLAGQISQFRYWAVDPQRRIDLGSDDLYAQAFYELFEDAVRVHLISDVPVGTCLSGGLDSSSVVAVINNLIHRRGLHVVGMETRQKTFSSRYQDFVQDEGKYIQSVVERFDVEPFMTFPAADDLQNEWQLLFHHLEEPFASTSIFAQYRVFKLAKQAGVTVTLDGQGGDELLAGYLGFFPYYFIDRLRAFEMRDWWADLRAHCRLHGLQIKHELRNIALNIVPTELKLAAKIRVADSQPWLNAQFVQSARGSAVQRWNGMDREGSQLTRRLLAALQFDPLPSLLRFDDRNSMAHSIESRVPFLDYRLIEFCMALPARQLIRGGITKFILRQAMEGILPQDIRARHDKIGFATPQSVWLRVLSPWLREVFGSTQFLQRPYFEGREIMRLLEAHVASERDYADILWRCLAVELWHRAMKV